MTEGGIIGTVVRVDGSDEVGVDIADGVHRAGRAQLYERTRQYDPAAAREAANKSSRAKAETKE